jgi:2-polyprenyl-3-methyl-5-hydroxy-6-metoxy-1,4-benzoquinol methylase
MKWKEAQKWEAEWWGQCVNSLFEEEKQIKYANKMGLDMKGNAKTPYEFDLNGASVIDVGGGAISLLLKCTNFKKAVVLDPLQHPKWVIDRYKAGGIEFWNMKAEDLNTKSKFDEAWMYNVLQHTQDPQKIVENVRKSAKLVRVFEWLETPISDGHIHSFTADQLNLWFGGYGKTEIFQQRPLIGKAFYGIFV